MTIFLIKGDPTFSETSGVFNGKQSKQLWGAPSMRGPGILSPLSITLDRIWHCISKESPVGDGRWGPALP